MTSESGETAEEHANGEALRTLVDPDVESAADLVAAGLDSGALVAIFGRCGVVYEGRAASELPAGDRHLMLKPDGAALVHAAAGQRPVNWQPPGSEHHCRVERGGDGGTAELVVESRRATPEERLVVRFDLVAHAAAFPAGEPEGDGPSASVVGTEADLKRRILADPDLVEPGFTPLATERETPAGAVDVYGRDEAGQTVVVELKRRRVGPDAVGQLERYVGALGRDLHADAEIRGVLVAPSVTARAAALLDEAGLEFVSLEPRPE